MIDAATNHNKVYQLNPGGESYRAAAFVGRAVELVAAKYEEPTGGQTLGDLQRGADALYADVYAKIAKVKPDALDRIGLTSPATQVTVFANGFPRAYNDFPTVFVSPYAPAANKLPDLYLYAPVDYKGRNFVPVDAKELDAKDAEKVGRILFAGGWMTPQSIFQMPRAGVAMPADFNPQIHQGYQGEYKADRTKAVFIAQGRSLDMVRDFEQRDKAWGDACHAVTEALKENMQAAFGKDMKPLKAAGEDFYMNSSYSYGGDLGAKTEFNISVRRKGNLGVMDMGQPLNLSSNAYVLVEKAHGGDYKVRPNDATPEGRELKKLFDAVPPKPSLADYPALRGNFAVKQDQIDRFIGVNGIVPQLRDMEGHKVLIYNRDVTSRSTFSPPDAWRMNTGLFLWLERDQGDRNLGVKPPPMPPALARMLDQITVIDLQPQPRDVNKLSLSGRQAPSGDAPKI